MPAPRSLADQLRGWPDARLATLLAERPDLATPAPRDSAQLAARLVVRTSVQRALDGLGTLELAVLQALVVEADPAELPAQPRSVADAVRRLEDLALVWGEPPRPVTTVGDALALPLGPPEAAVAARLGSLDPAAREVVTRLVESSALGRWSGGAGPIADLVDGGLLARSDQQHVTVPWTVRAATWASGEPLDAAPPLALVRRDPAQLDRAAAGAAFELVRRTELLLDRWGTQPPGVLRSGGLGVRDLKAAATLLHLEPQEAALVVETAAGAGLLAVGATDDHDAAWLPTAAFDAWQARPVAERWLSLARAWLESSRLVSAVGTRVADKPLNALAPELHRSWLPALRRDVLTELATTEAGDCLGDPASLARRLRWRRPRRPLAREEQLRPLLAEATQLGLLGRDGLVAHARALLDDGDPAALLGPLLPQPVDHVLVQADLTAVAPGPLEHEVGRRLAMVADVESRGGATVYRFDAGSVRRAFDAGWAAAEVHDFLGEVSRTPVPQSLSYLVDDVARRFGTLRVGAVEAFLRSDDETALTELVHAPEAAALRLRRIAPTVVISDLPVATLLPRLRELGLAPVVEAPDGTVRVARPDVFRARADRRAPASVHTAARSGAVVAAVRAGDRAETSKRDRSGAAVGPTEVIALLRECAETDARVLIGYVGDDGTVAERLVLPLRVEGGRLTAYDERSDLDRSFAIHRITAATRTR